MIRNDLGERSSETSMPLQFKESQNEAEPREKVLFNLTKALKYLLCPYGSLVTTSGKHYARWQWVPHSMQPGMLAGAVLTKEAWRASRSRLVCEPLQGTLGTSRNLLG